MPELTHSAASEVMAVIRRELERGESSVIGQRSRTELARLGVAALAGE